MSAYYLGPLGDEPRQTRKMPLMSRFTATWMTAGLCATLAAAVFAGPASAATAPGQVFAPNPVADWASRR